MPTGPDKGGRPGRRGEGPCRQSQQRCTQQYMARAQGQPCTHHNLEPTLVQPLLRMHVRKEPHVDLLAWGATRRGAMQQRHQGVATGEGVVGLGEWEWEWRATGIGGERTPPSPYPFAVPFCSSRMSSLGTAVSDAVHRAVTSTKNLASAWAWGEGGEVVPVPALPPPATHIGRSIQSVVSYTRGGWGGGGEGRTCRGCTGHAHEQLCPSPCIPSSTGCGTGRAMLLPWAQASNGK